MPKIIPWTIMAILILAAAPAVFGQKNVPPGEKTKSAVTDADDSDYYSSDFLAADLKQADVVAHVNVLSYRLIDQMGQGGCEQNKGVGYCLYLLKAQALEIFKGTLRRRNFEFYKVTDADYPYKEKMLGRHVVFLGWSSNYPDKKRSLGTLENSTRDIKHDILRKMRRLAARKR